jgi:hypothetical protein
MKKDMLIVVPYRNRERDLENFLKKTPEYFNKQNLSYDILICELENNCSWNAGMPCNSLIDFINIEKNYEWLYIHHVDITPISGDWKFPSDNEVYHNLGDYGSCLMKMKAFLDVGGYSNSFWGWGAEDNDLYSKFKRKNYIVTTLDDSYQVKYDTEYQNHIRAFNGKNYAHNLKELYLIKDSEKNNINNYHDHAITKNLVKLSENIYKQTVVSKKTCPNNYKNDKVLISYLKNQKDTKSIMPFIKSAMIFSSYSFDVVICSADNDANDHIINQIESFGANVYFHKIKNQDTFIDRYEAYKDFLIKNNHYKQVLHCDCLDIIFQSNPFNHIDENLIISSENILIKDEKWNKSILNMIYSDDIYESIKNNQVLCGGIIGGPIDKFINLCDLVVREAGNLNISNKHGSDQPILQKIIYTDNLDICIKNLNDAFCCNLHVYQNYKELLNNEIIIKNNNLFFNKEMKKFSIVHQYNRIPDSYISIYNHFNKYFYPIDMGG